MHFTDSLGSYLNDPSLSPVMNEYSPVKKNETTAFLVLSSNGKQNRCFQKYIICKKKKNFLKPRLFFKSQYNL